MARLRSYKDFKNGPEIEEAIDKMAHEIEVAEDNAIMKTIDEISEIEKTPMEDLPLMIDREWSSTASAEAYKNRFRNPKGKA